MAVSEFPTSVHKQRNSEKSSMDMLFRLNYTSGMIAEKNNEMSLHFLSPPSMHTGQNKVSRKVLSLF